MRTYTEILHDLLDGMVSRPLRITEAHGVVGTLATVTRQSEANIAIHIECDGVDAKKLIGREAHCAKAIQELLAEIGMFRHEQVFVKINPLSGPQSHAPVPQVHVDDWKRDDEVIGCLQRLMIDLGFNVAPKVTVVGRTYNSDFVLHLPERSLISPTTLWAINVVFGAWGKLNGRIIKVGLA